MLGSLGLTVLPLFSCLHCTFICLYSAELLLLVHLPYMPYVLFRLLTRLQLSPLSCYSPPPIWKTQIFTCNCNKRLCIFPLHNGGEWGCLHLIAFGISLLLAAGSSHPLPCCVFLSAQSSFTSLPSCVAAL